jgi:hypothetical protein
VSLHPANGPRLHSSFHSFTMLINSLIYHTH